MRIGRPPKTATLVMAFNGKKWFVDDGKPHVGFSYLNDLGFPIGLYFSYSERIQDAVTNKTCERFHCANGDNGLGPFTYGVISKPRKRK